jgi:DNA helicase-2/ATP-dependent DNA helicase PcrA
MESGIIEDLRNDKSPEGVSRAENAQELLNSIKEFTKIRTKEDRPFLLSNFMEEVSLLTDIEKKDTGDKDFVSLMTVHSAKGLEYKNVFIVGVEENLFPSLKTLQNNQSLEEERRLFYVAVTRAEKRLYISYSKSRMKWGNIEQCRPSRFIDEIDKEYINLPDDYDFKMKTTGGINQNRREGIKAANSKSTYIKKDTNRGLNMTSLSKDSKSNDRKTDIKQIGDLKIGNKVSHQRFGIGEIISFSGEGINSKAEVKFNKFGIKVLLLKFAKLKIIG